MKPKIVHVDFNDSMLGTIAREGEHNRTQLAFALDEDLQACDFINAEFGIEDSGEKLVLENLLPQEGENTLSVSLTQDVTVSGVLTIQLVGYVVDSETAEPRIIAKSPVVSGVVTPSINGIEKIAQGVAGFLDRILVKLNELAKKAHTHNNKDILDEITENPASILEDLIVGGRNLIKDGALDKQGRWVNGGLTVDFNQGYMVLNKEATSGRVSYYQTKKQNDMLAASENAQTYTATIEVMKLPGVAVPDNSSVEIHFGDSSRRLAMPVPLELSDSSWTILTATTPKDFDVFGDMTARIIVGQGEGGFACRNFRLESFTPALESVNEKVDKMSGAGLTEEQKADLNANTEARHTHSNKPVIDKLTEGADGKLKYENTEIGSGGIQSVTEFPTSAKEGDVVLLHRCNEISVDDSNSGVVLDTAAIASLKLPEGITDRYWEFDAPNPTGHGFNLVLQQTVIAGDEPYVLTGIVLFTETFGGRWYWRDGKPYYDIPNATDEPLPDYIPLGVVESFTATKDPLYGDNILDIEDTDNTTIFRTVPREYMYTGGEWKLTERTDIAEGNLISDFGEIEKNGQKFFRLDLTDSRSFKNRNKKAVDIPIEGVKKTTTTVGGIVVESEEIVFPKPENGDLSNYYTKQEIDNKGFITKADIPTDESYELIGETPLTLAEKSNIKLESAVETTYEAKTPTVWNFDDTFANGDYTLKKCTLEKENDHYKVVSDDTVTAHYQSYVLLYIPVEAGKTYTLCWDNSASKKNTTEEPIDWGGFFSLYDGEDTSKLLSGSVTLDNSTKQEVTPTTNVLQIRYYPAKTSATSKAGCIARFNSVYLNASEETTLTEIYSISGTFNGSIILPKVPKGATVTATPTAKVYVKAPTDKTLTKSDVPADAKATGERIEAVKNLLPLYGKTIVNFGDSIFGNAQPPVDISTHLANKTGATVYNCGFGGCRMTPHSSSDYNAFSMCNLATAISSGDFTQQNEAVANGNLAERYSVGLERLKSIDFSKIDIVTIAYGSNDFNGNGAPLENAENPYDITAFGGALRYSIETLLNTYPNLKIFILSIAWRFWTNDNNEYVDDTNTHTNNSGKLTKDYNIKLQEVAAEYNLPYVDDYNIGIGKHNRSYYFNANDGAHHKETGRKLIAEHLAGALVGSNNTYSSNAYERVDNPTYTNILPNKEYVFGEMAELTVNFAEGSIGKRNEYLFSFISGETATVLTLPSSVKWVNELTVEANKRYEISVVDDVALWCAVEVTE